MFRSAAAFLAFCPPFKKTGLLIFLLFCQLQNASADDHAYKVNGIKSAFIYNIAKFVTWPDNPERNQNVLQVCFYKQDFIGKAFATVKGRSIHGRVVKQKVITELPQSLECDILLLNQSDMQTYQQEYQAESAASGLLTIADLTTSRESGRIYPGVLITLVRHKASMGFEVSLHQVKQRRLELSSQLLKLAKILEPEN
ncbi:MAG: YfiR family protein [Neptuniibacter sp.]